MAACDFDVVGCGGLRLDAALPRDDAVIFRIDRGRRHRRCFETFVQLRLCVGVLHPLPRHHFIEPPDIGRARIAGKGSFAISREHILPNIANLLIVQGTIQFALGILAEAALSYIGLGTQPPHPSWGRMLAVSQTYYALGPWLALFPGLAIVLTVLGLNLLGDGLRDLLDPKSRAER